VKQKQELISEMEKEELLKEKSGFCQIPGRRIVRMKSCLRRKGVNIPISDELSTQKCPEQVPVIIGRSDAPGGIVHKRCRRTKRCLRGG
jgi:hypothetical protein